MLAGDHRQLAPVIKSEYAKRAGYSISLHRRIANNVAEDPSMSHTLLEHYRSHPSIMFLYNQLYYEGRLVCKADPATRPPLHGFPAEKVRGRPPHVADDPSDPHCGGFNADSASGGEGDVHRGTLIHVDGEEASTRDGGKANLKEAKVVGDLLERIAPQCVSQGFSVVVTTPCATQRSMFEHGASCQPCQPETQGATHQVRPCQESKEEGSCTRGRIYVHALRRDCIQRGMGGGGRSDRGAQEGC